MEERLQKALEHANYRLTLNNQLHKVRTRAEAMLTIAKNGGTFKIDHEFICYLDFLVRKNTTSAVILDSNKIPVQILDVEAFLDEITVRYFEVTNDYLQEYHSIRKSRNVKSILDLKDDK
jgi:hypothetical protein